MKNSTALTVSELNNMAKSVLESGFASKVWVEGEISNLTLASSGHRYFDIKDDKARVPCAMFRGSAAKNDPGELAKIKAGDQVRVSAQVTMYTAQGKYQLIVSRLEPVGAGQLMKEFEALKQKLSTEGLFDESRKRRLPTWPRSIAVITSPTGAAVRDVLSTLARRSPFIPVRIYPTMVQGDTAAPKIIDALKAVYQDVAQGEPIDVLVLTRGGGSIEDLHCFNDEALARLLASSPIPTISGVGHEIDFTIVDFIADLRAPTPTSAAELVSPDREEQLKLLKRRVERLKTAIETRIQQKKKTVEHYAHRLTMMHPKKQVLIQSQRLDELAKALQLTVDRRITDKKNQLINALTRLANQNPSRLVSHNRSQLQQAKHRLNMALAQRINQSKLHLKGAAARLTLLSPYGVMERGYSLAYADEKLIKSVAQIRKNDTLTIQFIDGSADVIVDSVNKK